MLASSRCCQIRRLPWALSVWMQQQVNIMAGLTLCRAESARSGAYRCRCRLAGEDLPAVDAVGVDAVPGQHHGRAESGACRGCCWCRFASLVKTCQPWVLSVWMQQQVNIMAGLALCQADSGACRCRCRCPLASLVKTCQPWVLSAWMLYQVNIMAGLALCRAESARSGACRCRCRLAGEDLPAVGAVGLNFQPVNIMAGLNQALAVDASQ